MIPILVSALSTLIDLFYQATPFVILALTLALCWQLGKAVFSFLKASAKLIAFAALLIALNSALNRREDISTSTELDIRGYAQDSLKKWEQMVEETTFDELLAANLAKIELFEVEDRS